MKTHLAFLLAFVCSLGVVGQTPLKERCGTRIDYEKLRKSNPFLYNYLQEINRKAAEYTQKRLRGQVSPRGSISQKPAHPAGFF